MKSSRNYKVVSCSGITDADLPGQDKCPFYSGEFDCTLDGHIIENPLTIPITVIPEDCLLRRFNIEVITDVLNQAEVNNPRINAGLVVKLRHKSLLISLSLN